MINLGIVGLGRWGQRHVDAAIASGRFRVVRAVTPRPDRVAEFASIRSIAVSADVEDLFADPLVDAVSLVTPNSLHARQIVRVASSGRHVLAEKPFALTREDAEKAVEACVKAGIVVAVGHDNRFYPAIVELKRLVDSGVLGKILHAEANISHKGSREREMKAAVPSASAAWRRDRREAPAGSMIHVGIHRIDSYVQLFGKIDQLYAQASADTPDTAFADSVSVLVQFRTGMTGYIASSQVTPLNSRMQVFGTQGWAEATGPHDFQEYARCSLKKIRVHRSDGTIEAREFDAIDSVRANLEAFADAIEGKSPYPIPPDELIHVVAVLEAVVTAIETGQPVLVS